jgi:hypothetical protein
MEFGWIGGYTYAMHEREKPYMGAVEAIRARYLAKEFRDKDPMFDIVVSELLCQIDNLRMGMQDFRDRVALQFVTRTPRAMTPKAAYEEADKFIQFAEELKAKEARAREDRAVCLPPTDQAEGFGS